VDEDGDGFPFCDALCDLPDPECDCDDTNPAIHPGAQEICNNLDDDCDGEIDEGGDCFNDCKLEIVVTATPDSIFIPPPPGCATEGPPKILTFEYTGGGCAASDNGQSSASCTGDIDPGAAIDVAARSAVRPYTVEPSSVTPGERFSVRPRRGAFAADLFIELTNAGGIEAHHLLASCASPLQVGDVFGSLTLVAFNLLDQPAPRVAYEYDIKNHGGELFGVDITDDHFGTLVDSLDMSPGTHWKLGVRPEILNTTTNIVTAAGHTTATDGPLCIVRASATVTVVRRETDQPEIEGPSSGMTPRRASP